MCLNSLIDIIVHEKDFEKVKLFKRSIYYSITRIQRRNLERFDEVCSNVVDEDLYINHNGHVPFTNNC